MSSMNIDMTKTQAESLYRGAINNKNELKERLFDEFIAKLKTEIDTPPTSAANTPTSEELPSISIGSSSSTRSSPYQATVEDDTSSDADMAGSMSSHNSSSNTRYSTPTSSVSDLNSSKSSKSSRPESILVKPKRSGSSSNSPRHSPGPRPTVHFSDRPAVHLHSRSEPVQRRQSPPTTSPTRAAQPDVSKQDFSLSAVDKKWGQLFTEADEPTARLGQFLRGIANFMIAEYKPVNSLVVTPEKLYTFYTQFKLDSEVFPFQRIFDTRSSNSTQNLEYLYRDLQCEYHLVQGKPGSKPRIPALTPKGFQEWMTQHILAFPDQEAKRLGRVIRDLPITTDGPGADGKPERLPKQLSRHLLPARRNIKIHQMVVASIANWIEDAGLMELPSTRQTTVKDVSKPSVPVAHVEPPKKLQQQQQQQQPTLRRAKSDDKSSSSDSSSSSKRRHKSRDRHSRSSYDRETTKVVEATTRQLAQADSEENMRHLRDISPRSPYRSVRAPGSVNRYRESSAVEGGSVPALERNASSTSVHSVHSSSGPSPRSSTYALYPSVNVVEHRSNGPDRFYQCRDPRSVPETPPVTTPSSSSSSSRSRGKRPGMALAIPKDQDPGLTWGDYFKMNPQSR